MTQGTAVIVDAARTPVGRANKGSLVAERPDDLGAFVVHELVQRTAALDPAQVDDIIFGAAAPEGQQGLGLARIVARLAGLPDVVPGLTVSRACASSLQSIQSAAHAIAANAGEIYIAGGVESVSRVPGLPGADDLNPRFTDPTLSDYLDEMYVSMLQTAENVADRFGVSRERMDEYAALSQQRATAARHAGYFDREILPYATARGIVAQDDGIRERTTVEGLSALTPILDGGRVTAGNACPLNDGAAAVIVMSESRARADGIAPLARVVDSTVTGLDPQIMGVGPVDAVRKLLARNGLQIGDIDIVELNEAFASQVLAVADQLGISIEDQLNPHGGAIALGHPFGMTGARMVGTLINGLRTRDQTLGIATLCIGGGQGMAMLIERLG